MPMDKSKYPPNWTQISMAIRDRAMNRCECRGECGLHRDRQCSEVNGTPATFAKGRVILTVAHLNHDTTDNRDANLKAMCQRCHLRVDGDQHRSNARKTRRARKAVGDLFEIP